MPIARDARAVDRAVADGATRLFVFFGGDETGARNAAQRVLAAAGADAERVDLEAAALIASPGRLADEAAALSLFGATRIIRVTGVTPRDDASEAARLLLDAPVTGSVVVMIAGDLKKTNALYKLVADHPRALGLAMPRMTGETATALVLETARIAGVRPDAALAASIARSTDGNRGLIETEVEKLALYLDAAPDKPKVATPADVAALRAAVDPDFAMGPLVNAVVAGDMPTLGRISDQIAREAMMIPALRMLVQRLVVMARIWAGNRGRVPGPDAVDRYGRALFRADKHVVTQTIAAWPPARIEAAMNRIAALDAALKARNTAGDVLARAELLTIASVRSARR